METYIKKMGQLDCIVVNKHDSSKTKGAGDGSSVFHVIYNIGNNGPENLLDFVRILTEELIRVKVLPDSFRLEENVEYAPMQPGDVPVTYADTTKIGRDFILCFAIILRLRI